MNDRTTAAQALRNKLRMQAVMEALSRGDGHPFGEAMSDEFTWTIPGHSVWSGTWRGKAVVRERLLGPLFAQFADRYTNRPVRFIAEDDIVVVECRGHVTTTRGDTYANTYCYVCRFDGDGLLVELIEYMDTAHAEAVLEPPPTRPA